MKTFEKNHNSITAANFDNLEERGKKIRDNFQLIKYHSVLTEEGAKKGNNFDDEGLFTTPEKQRLNDEQIEEEYRQIDVQDKSNIQGSDNSKYI